VATSTAPDLYRAREGTVDLVDVPEAGFVVASGRGAPEAKEFAAAVGALYKVAYTAHFLARRLHGEAPRIMPLEALWWVEDGGERWAEVPREAWHWQAMIGQPDPIDAATAAEALDQVRAKADGPLLDVGYQRWREGPAAQVLHVGPFSTEPVTVDLLHRAIAERGLRPHGRHHEIYLSNPKRTASARLRTLLRQPVEPAVPQARSTSSASTIR
jgi:hypothetical protein